MAFVTTPAKALAISFYQNSLDKVKTFQEKSYLMLYNLTVDLVTDAAGRDQRAAEGTEPDWHDLREQAKIALENYSEQELRDLLSKTFGLETQEDILTRFGQIRSRKQRNSGGDDFGNGDLVETDEPEADLDDPEDLLDDEGF